MKLEENLIKLCPKALRLPVKYNYNKIRNRLEPELLYLNRILTQCKRAIDIGANDGLYSYVLAQISENVEAFEPQTWCTHDIAFYSDKHRKNINIYNVGLSSFKGLLNLHIPVSYSAYSRRISGLGSITPGLASFREIEGEQACVEVPVNTLDDYNFTDVSFIKIDVEGHESRVIQGGHKTIVREKPILLVEIEQRHLDGHPIEMVFQQILELGYEGSYLYSGNLIPLSKFSYKEHQEPFLNNPSSKDHIRNFIFRPISKDKN